MGVYNNTPPRVFIFLFVCFSSLTYGQTGCTSNTFLINFLTPHDGNEVTIEDVGCSQVQICIRYEYQCDVPQNLRMGFRFRDGTLEITNPGNFPIGPIPDPSAPGFISIEDNQFFAGPFTEQTRCFTAKLIGAGDPTFSYGFFEEANAGPSIGNVKEFKWWSDGTKVVSGSLQQLSGSMQLLPTDNKWFIDGVLEVDVPNYSIVGNNIERGKIQFAPGGRLVINNRSNFTIDETDISGCEEMWDKIEVKSGGSINMTNSTVQDGIRAIEAQPFSTVSLTNNIFTNNDIGLMTRGYGIRVGDFSENTFSAPGTKAGQVGTAAVWLIDMLGVSLEGTGNKISKMSNGLVGVNSNFSMSGFDVSNLLKGSSSFLNHEIGVDATGRRGGLMKIEDCSFSNQKIGVNIDGGNTTLKNSESSNVDESFNTNLGENILVEGNNFSANEFGIRANTPKSLRVLNNKKIEVNGTPASSAINIESVTNVLGNVVISNNEDIIGNNATNTIIMRNGLFLNAMKNSISNANENGNGINTSAIRLGSSLYCNGITGAGDGNGIFDIDTKGTIICNRTTGSGTGVNFAGFPGNVAFRGNDMMGNAAQGILINGGGTAIGQQLQHGNAFFSDATHNGRNVLGSQFIVNSTMSPVFPLNVNTPAARPGQLWFDVEEGEAFECADAECSSGFVFPDFPDPPEFDCKEYTVLDGLIADGSVNTDDMREGNWWNAQRQLLDKIRIPCPETPPVMPPDVAAFASVHQNSILGQLLDVTIGMKALELTGSNEYETLENVQTTLDVALASWFDLANQLEYETLTESERANIYSEEEVIIANIQDLHNQETIALENYLTAKATLANQLLIQNEAITPNSIPAQNEHAVNSIYLQTSAIGVELNSEQLSTLFSIASQCPQDGGISVHQARSMYISVHHDEVFSDEGCDSQDEFRISSPANTPKIVKAKVTPNPTDGIININIPVDEVRTVKIVNSLGQLLMTDEKANDQYQLSFDISEYGSGIYFIQIWNGDTLESTDKISLVK